jgi:hypothetical protein
MGHTADTRNVPPARVGQVTGDGGKVALVLVVLIAWTLVAMLALLLVGALCAAAAKADAADRERSIRRPVGVPVRVVVVPIAPARVSDPPMVLVRR